MGFTNLRCGIGDPCALTTQRRTSRCRVRNHLPGGLSICKLSLIYWNLTCFTNLNWTEKLDQSTSVSVFQPNATTAYDCKNLSILRVESISSPEPVAPQPASIAQVFQASSQTQTRTRHQIKQNRLTPHYFSWDTSLECIKIIHPGDSRTPVDVLRGFITCFSKGRTFLMHLPVLSLTSCQKVQS